MARRTAAQAREEMLKNLNGPLIQVYVDHIDDRIEAAIAAGSNIIFHPFGSSENMPKVKWPTDEERDATFKHFIDAGYTVTFHNNSDPDHPGTCDYHTIEW